MDNRRQSEVSARLYYIRSMKSRQNKNLRIKKTLLEKTEKEQSTASKIKANTKRQNLFSVKSILSCHRQQNLIRSQLEAYLHDGNHINRKSSNQ